MGDYSELRHPWHNSEALQRALLDFHAAKAAFPELLISAAQRHQADVMKAVYDDLIAQNVALKFEFTGSSAEGVKVPSTEVEFDVLVILPNGGNVRVDKTKPLFAKLHVGDDTMSVGESPLVGMVDPSTCYLLAKKAREFFHSRLQRTINRYKELKDVIKLCEHGPAVQMNVYRTPRRMTNANLFYKVDLVPCVYIAHTDQYYVGKPHEDLGPHGWHGNPALAWRRSFSVPERRLVRKMGTADECHKHCIRILKVLRDVEPGLRHLNSYIIKTAILSLARDDPHLDWRMWNMGRRFTDLLQYLAGHLEQGVLHHFFVPSVNLLENFTFPHRANMETRIKELLRSESHFFKLLDSV